LSAHSAFRTAEANRNLIEAALVHCRRIAAAARGASVGGGRD
jgi:D-3-phosphoglycerate dehydrogenase